VSSETTLPCAPIRFTPRFQEKIWGGRNLATRLNKPIPDGPIGESWEISGQGNDITAVHGGPFDGTQLDTLFAGHKADLAGPSVRTDSFPLLYKFIDAQDKLSIQVHPNDEEAVRYQWDILGKTECWYIVDAKPDAEIIVGFKPGVTSAKVRTHIAENRLEKLLNRIPIKGGDMLLIPAGTVHAILDGTLLFEVQETSDITLRLYDWGRLDRSGNPRDLHVEESLKVLDFSSHDNHKIPPCTYRQESGCTVRMRTATRYFAVEEYLLSTTARCALPRRKSFQVVTAVKGEVGVQTNDSSANLNAGESLLIPWNCTESFLTGSGSEVNVLVSWVPDLKEEIVTFLQDRSVDTAAIVTLGGNEKTNDLRAYC